MARSAVLDEAGALAFPVAVRVELREPLTTTLIETRLAVFERRQIPLWLAIPAAASQSDIDRWRGSLRGLLERRLSTLTILEIVVDREPSAVAIFSMQVAATEARARRGAVQLALGGPAMDDPQRREQIYSADLAPYVDLLVVVGGHTDAVAGWQQRFDSLPRIAMRSAGDAPPGVEPARRMMDDILQDPGSDVSIRAWRASDVTADALRTLSPLSSLLTHPISTLDASAVELKLTIAQEDVTTAVRHRLLFDTRTFSTFLIYWGEPAAAPLGVSLTIPVEGLPGVHDLLTGARPAVTGYTRNTETRKIQASVPLTGRPMLVDFNEGAGDVLIERSDVSAAKRLSVAEIISRHQQAQLTQDVLVRNYSATARMRQFFRPTITDSGYDVVTENRYFVEGPDIEWEELSFSVNGSKWESDRPPFPLLQPEKVLSIPLQLRFDDGYTYRLEGTERVDGFDCYIVRFEPIRRDSALYRGTIWIDERTFARIRVKAVQSGLSAPVVSNEETHRYVPAMTIGNQPIFLFGGLTAQQIVLVAGRNLLVEKEVSFSDFMVNDAEFDARRTAARASDRIMFRETDGGLRHYVKEGESRVISERQTSQVRALAMGVYVDPSLRVSAADFRAQLLELQTRRIGKRAVRAALRRRARRRKPPATKARLDGAGRQPGLLRDRRTFERSAVRPRRRTGVPTGADLANVHRAQSWMAGIALPEGDAPVSVPLRRLHPRHDDGGNLRAAIEHADQWRRRRLGVPSRRIQHHAERHLVRAGSLGRVG